MMPSHSDVDEEGERSRTMVAAIKKMAKWWVAYIKWLGLKEAMTGIVFCVDMVIFYILMYVFFG